MKYRIYIDEVGNSDLKSSKHIEHRYLCLAGAIMELNYVRDVFHPRLEQLKRKYFDTHPDEPVILHRKELLQAKPPFTALKEVTLKSRFNNELLTLLRNTKFQIIAVLIDKLEHNEGYTTWKYDPYHYCQEIIIERFRLFLKLKNAKGDVIIESRGGKEDMRLKKSFNRLMENGTQYLTEKELMEVFTSKQLKVKAKLANIAGLQLADLIAHPVRRWFFKNMLALNDDRHTFSDEILHVIEPKFFSYKGKIEGYGMKKLP